MKREEIYRKLHTAENIASLLALPDFSPVYEEADHVRQEAVGDTVHLRAIIEFSNICRRQCLYCGLNRENASLTRFRMGREEIAATAAEAVDAGYRTIVLQSGEDAFFTAEVLGEIISDIKALDLPQVEGGRAGFSHPALRHPAVTVSCGERPPEDYRYWQEKGADRYLLKHETADPDLYDALHPCGTLAQRIDCLKELQSLGYETGSGFMVGLPGQTPETLGRDLLLLKEIPCKMAGIGPFIANPKTPLAGSKNGDPELTKRCVAIARLLLPEANLPLTTALSVVSAKTADPHPQNPFACGANVIMKKVTPDAYKEAYEIYPAAFASTNIREDRRELERMIRYYDRIPL